MRQMKLIHDNYDFGSSLSYLSYTSHNAYLIIQFCPLEPCLSKILSMIKSQICEDNIHVSLLAEDLGSSRVS